MIGPGWLERTNPHDSTARLAAKVKEHLGDQTPGRALEATLANTDKGKKSAKWWAENAATVPALALALGRSETDVRAWIGACTAAPSQGWTPPNLRSVRAVPVDQPPPELWPDDVEKWLGRLERDVEPVTRGWFQAEPGLPVDWLAARMERRGWEVRSGKPWSEAVRRLPARGRVLIVLIEPVSRQQVQQAKIPSGATVLVAAPHRLAGYADRTSETGRKAKNRGRGPDDMAVWEGWVLLDDTSDTARVWSRTSDALTVAISTAGIPIGTQTTWFLQHATPERRPTTERLDHLCDRYGSRQLPGEVLLLLDVAVDDDPVEAWLDRLHDADVVLLEAIEDEAIRQGIGMSRPLDVWCSLLPSKTDDATTLAAARKALAHGHMQHAQALLDGRPEAVIERLRSEGHLCRDPGRTDAWVLWPRWLGRELRRRAGERLAKSPTDRGTALLDADEDIAREALGDLRDLVRTGAWDELRRGLASDLIQLDGAAHVEGVALAVGLHLLDGGDVPPEVADEIAGRLLAVRGAAQGEWRRLLCRGDGVFGDLSTEAAAWALGARCAAVRHTALGPWDGAEGLTPRHIERLEKFETELGDLGNRRRWGRQAEEGETLAVRLFRLGTMLFKARGLVEAPTGVWSLQVPSLLADVASGARELPGRTVREVLAETAPDLPLPRDLKNIDLQRDLGVEPGALPDEQQSQAFVRALGTMFLASLASEDARVRHRERALAQVRATADAHFADVAREVIATGGGIVDVVRWLWGHWREVRSGRSDLPPIRALERDDDASAKLLWNLAPPDVPTEIWEKASERVALWRVLDATAWRAWARCGINAEAGWREIPEDVLVTLFDEGLCNAGWSAAWSRVPDATAHWLVRALRSAKPPVSTRDALDAVDAAHVPTLLKQAPEGALPAAWLQLVVTARHDGWREAWRRLKAIPGGPPS